MRSGGVAGFAPSRSGFRFANSFAPGPYLRVLGVPIGNAANGVCGGMVFAVHDALVAGVPVPVLADAPRYGSPLFRYLSLRLFASFGLRRLSFLRYYAWMLRSDRVLLRLSSLAWPTVRASLDAGRPVPLGLVTMRGADPRRLGRNHQVLAYGYTEDRGQVSLAVYDPNSPGRDDIRLHCLPGRGGAWGAIAHTVGLGGRPVRGFFVVRYRPADPRAAFAAASGGAGGAGSGPAGVGVGLAGDGGVT